MFRLRKVAALASSRLFVVALIISGCSNDAISTVAVDRVPPTDSAAPMIGPTGPSESPAAEAAAATATPIAVPTATTVPTPTTVPTATPLPMLTRTLLFSGDVLSHTPVIAQALRYGIDTELTYDYRPMFDHIAPRVSRADLSICVLETPVSSDNVGLDGYPTFEAPRELPDALVTAGYDGCSTASNHSMDRGPDGVQVTLDQMDRVGLGHAGMARTEAEALTPRIYDVGGVAVAHLSYSYSLNGFLLPADKPWLVNLNDAQVIVDEAIRARAVGADVVVLSIQWGNEYQRTPSEAQVSLAEMLTLSGEVDVIMGNHVHVVQPVTTVNGVPVVYGLGNSLSNQSDNCCRTGTQDGVMVEVRIRGNQDVGFAIERLAFAPTWVDRTNFRLIDLITALGDPDLGSGERTVYQASFDRTVDAVQSLGADLPLAG